MRGSLFLAGLLLAALSLLACGGGGGGGSPTEMTPPPPVASITFTPQGAPGSSTVFLASGAATTATTLVLEVRANQVTDLYGVAFDLTYPSTILTFSRATAGPLLGTSGSVQAAVSTPGTLVVGGSHLGAVPGATGSGVLLTLEFTATAAGQGNFAFARNSAFNSAGQTPAGISWLAGSVRVIR